MKNFLKRIWNKFTQFWKRVWHKFVQLLKFSLNDLKKRYAGSIAGILWAYVLPLVTILVFWFVFELGFRQQPVKGTTFILWFVPAYVAWTFANDSILQSSGALYEYSFLVKKVKFNITYLPIVKVLSSFLIHTFFIAFIFILNAIYQTPFNPNWFNVFYYTFALSILLVGLSWIASSITVFWKDFSHIINVVLQVGFWATPVFWEPTTMNEKVLNVLKFNPLYYIVEGYRHSFIPYTELNPETGEVISSSFVPFWGHWKMMIYYWVFAIAVFVIGLLLFKKLSKHYADLI